MKRIFAALLVLTFAAFCFQACVSRPSGEPAAKLASAAALEPARADRAPTSLSDVAKGFHDSCTRCHEQYASLAAVTANKQAIFARLSWIGDGSGFQHVATDMPQEGSPEGQHLMDFASRTLRLAMLDFVRSTGPESNDYPVSRLHVPAGFRISLVAKLPGARSIARASDGTIFVSTGGFTNPKTVIYRLKDWNGDGRIDQNEVDTPITGLDDPNGVAFRNGKLYVAQVDRVLVYSNILSVPRGRAASSPTRLPQQLPSVTLHGWKFIRFAPPPNDNWLYVPVGAPCNICKPPSPHAAIYRFDVNSSAVETVARGVRNTVGFDFNPTTGNLWFTENGRDSLGDDLPPDELNEVTGPGLHFGYPYCHGRGIVDPGISFEWPIMSCADTVEPVQELAPHAAALGMRFYRGSQFPREFQKQIFIAEHGSWNRSKKNGYRVTTVKMINGRPRYEPFVTGWLNEQTQAAWGRPVDVEELPDGSLLISDDGIDGTVTDGALYRVEYVGP
jgi:glucose/arabinose dehydrogenase